MANLAQRLYRVYAYHPRATEQIRVMPFSSTLEAKKEKEKNQKEQEVWRLRKRFWFNGELLTTRQLWRATGADTAISRPTFSSRLIYLHIRNGDEILPGTVKKLIMAKRQQKGGRKKVLKGGHK